MTKKATLQRQSLHNQADALEHIDEADSFHTDTSIEGYDDLPQVELVDDDPVDEVKI